MLPSVLPVLSLSSCKFTVLNFAFYFSLFFVVFDSNKSLLPVLNDREDFRKSFKENHPDNKSVSVVRFQTQLLLLPEFLFLFCLRETRGK